MIARPAELAAESGAIAAGARLRRCQRLGSAYQGRAHAGGFTLVEILLATVLLAAGLALAFATLSAASQTATRGELLAARNERIRAVEGFLRKRLASARPIAFAIDPRDGVPQRFAGEPGRLRFVADLPDYLGQGGPHLHDFSIRRQSGQQQLLVDLQLVSGGQTFPEIPPRAPEVLVEGLEQVRFRYRGTDRETGELAAWQDRWSDVDRLPQLVEVILTDADGRKWPALVIALPQAAGSSARGLR